MAKEDNPTETPQVRPIEDFFGVLATHVYQGDWVAKDTEALKRRIIDAWRGCQRILCSVPWRVSQDDCGGQQEMGFSVYAIDILIF